MPQWFATMGAVGWPLGLCSLIAAALILERLQVFLSLAPLRQAVRQAALSACRDCDPQECEGLWRSGRRGWSQALGLLLQHRQLAPVQREDMLGCWLLEERQRLCRYLRLLQLIGVLAPMLGLLGTVLGMVAMFADIAAVDQPVTPALLADGLWQALHTTIWGLFIAIPALAAGQGFALWSERHLEGVQTMLNRCNLALEGLELTPATATTARWAGA